MLEVTMGDESSRICPVCGGSDPRLVHRQHFLGGLMGAGYEVVACAHCGAAFADGIPSQAEMDKYYAEQSKYTYSESGGAESPWDFKRFEKTAAQIIPHLTRSSTRILDIGCATGGLLSVFKGRGFQEVMGVDPSPACAESAKRLHGVRVEVATIARLNGWEERFDLITMLGVLEHLREVKNAVEIASRLLKPGGLIYVAVPDVVGLADCPNAPYQQFSEEHVNFFSIHTLNHVMADCGMGAIKTWNWKVEWREGVLEPIASGLYRLTPTKVLFFDGSTGPALGKYLALSERGDRKIVSAIDSLVSSREPVLVWGAGTLARRLLATTQFSGANIAAFVDSNPNLQGRQLAGRPILAPAQAANRKESILICSVSFAKEIAEAIRNKHGLHNRVITLHGGDPS